ncbi:MAG: hypothetical protein MZV64_64090 [Ignavibacteriales bacterium]|nr:hypothetical protein [Ignavibacteriales bacterium]
MALAGMSVIWPLGDAIPPTAIIGRLTAATVGLKEPYGKFLKVLSRAGGPHRRRRNADGRLQQEALLPDGVLTWRPIVTLLYYLLTAYIAVSAGREFPEAEELAGGGALRSSCSSRSSCVC